MINTVLFDLDGTIIDTNELIIQTFLHVLKDKEVYPNPFTREHIIPHMGMPLAEQFRLFTNKEQVDDLVAAYREYNVQIHDELVREFPNVREVISKLYESGIQLGVVTTKMRNTTLMGLKRFGLHDYMKTIVTIEDVKNPKPHPEPVQRAIEALGAEPSTTLMVGDSQYDIESANRAGAVSAAVAWSLKGEQYLRQFSPKYVIHDMRDLLPIVGLERDSI